MTYFFALLFIVAAAIGAFLFAKNKRLNSDATRIRNESDAAISEAQQMAAQQVFQMQQEAQAAVAEAQKLINQQFADMQQESERIREHYEKESRKSQEEAEIRIAELKKDYEPLRKYEVIRDSEAEVRQRLTSAMKETADLQSQAQSLLEQAKNFAGTERSLAIQKAKEIRQQAEALLTQATRDAGRIMADAETRAEQIGGDAYVALRDKQTLERAVQALWNVTEGYGDRYVVPTHSILDELAISFGYTEAGLALKAAREQSRRMVEQKQASSCNYEEADRRERANRFIVDAFNGRVDAILTRSKHDNYGTLEQEIKDAFSLVNLNGLVFRDARILPAYLDARLSELKWAVAAHELARKQREEQRYLKDRMRDEEKARRENEERMRQAAKEEALKQQAVEEAERRFAGATAEQKKHYEQELQKLRQDLIDAKQRALTVAQQTKKGHVYVISNIGSFGEGVYKIGQTRRPDPQDRVDELSVASVPFEFDVHALIETENAPVLEHKLHKRFIAMQVNKMNPRKEFFRISLSDIRQEVDKLKTGEDFTVKLWTDKAVASEYIETLDIEKDPQKREIWLARQKAMTDRQIQLDALQLTVPEESTLNNESNDD